MHSLIVKKTSELWQAIKEKYNRNKSERIKSAKENSYFYIAIILQIFVIYPIGSVWIRQMYNHTQDADLFFGLSFLHLIDVSLFSTVFFKSEYKLLKAIGAILILSGIWIAAYGTLAFCGVIPLPSK